MKKIITSLAVIAMIAGVAFGVTGAFFSDTATSKNNTFTAGTLDIELADNNESFPLDPTNDDGDDASATWVSPSKWLPGDSVTGTLRFTNPSDADIKSMSMDFNVVSRDGNGDGSHLDEKIIITEWKEHFKDTENGGGWHYYTDIEELEGWLKDSGAANGDGILTLAELNACDNFLGKGAPGPVTQDASFQGGDGILLKAGNYKDYQLELTFEFDYDAGNEYQNDSCELEIEFDARHDCPWFGCL
jgi:predicted ribosomally synthesized peptide with SipW-like signal peptide